MRHRLGRLMALVMLGGALAACTSDDDAAEDTASEATAAVAATASTAPLQTTTEARLGAWEACATPQNLPESIPLGVNLGLTGVTAQYSIPQQQGIQLAIDEINSSGYLNGATLRGIYEDSGDNNEGAIAAMEKLIDEDEVIGVIGPSFSRQAFAADPVAQEAGIPVIGVTNLAAGITAMGPFIFRVGLLDDAQIRAAVEELHTFGVVNEAALIYSDNDDFTVTGAEVFREISAELNIDIVREETFQTGEVDFNAQLTNLIAAEPDAIFMAALIAEAIPLVNQTRELGYEGIIVGNNGFNAPGLLAESGDNAEGIVIGAAWHVSSDNPLNMQFVADYQTRFNALPDQFAAQAYTAAWLFATALRCGDSAAPDDIRAQLTRIEDFATPLGDFSFNDQRDPVHAATAQIVMDGQFEILTRARFEEAY